MIDRIRDADWLDGARARDWRRVLLGLQLLIAIGWVAASRQGIDPTGKPLGTDFLAFWSAARMAIAGHAAQAYDLAAIHAVEAGAMSIDPGGSSFLYPPPFLLICLPFGTLPYFTALLLWLAIGGVAFALAIRAWLPRHARGWASVAAFPAVLITLGHGQNAFLTAALLGGGLALLDRRPALAGVALGLLVIKPQVALAVPVLLIVGRHWRALAAALASATLACLAATYVFGPGIWPAFLAGGALGRQILTLGLVEPGKMVSLYAGLRVLGLSNGVAGLGQALIALVALVVMVRRPHPAVAILASALISPFLLDYDLLILAMPLAWLLGEGMRRGWWPWEKTLLLTAYVLPLIGRDLALMAGVPLAPPVLLGLLWVAGRATASDHRHAAVDVQRLPRDIAGLAAG